jgi:hypothetical protein
MKKLIITILSLAIAFALVSCDGSTEPNIESSTADETTTADILAPEGLVRLSCGFIDIGGGFNPFNADYVNKFNQLLLQKGYNFNFRFVHVAPENYAAKLQSGEVDIVYTGVGLTMLSNEVLSNFAPLSISDEVKDLFLDTQWEQVTQDGAIKAIPAWTPYNAIKIWTRGEPKDFMTLLNTIGSDETLVFHSSLFNIFDMIGDCCYDGTVVYDIDDGVFRSPLDEKYIPIYRKLRTMYENGQFIMPKPDDIVSDGAYAYIDNYPQSEKPDGYGEIIVKPYNNLGTCTGIGTGSAHKAEAEQFLNILLTDAELTRTLFYGTAEEPANAEEMQQLVQSIMTTPLFFGYTRFAGLYPDENRLLSRPYDFDDPKTVLSDNTRPGLTVKPSNAGYDTKPFSDIIISLNSFDTGLICNNDDEFDFDNELNTLLEQLETAGYSEWLNYLNLTLED